MPTILQLSEATYLNLDTVTVLRYTRGQWCVWFQDTADAVPLTEAETAVLALYLWNHTERTTYNAYVHTHRQPETTP